MFPATVGCGGGAGFSCAMTGTAASMLVNAIRLTKRKVIVFGSLYLVALDGGAGRAAGRFDVGHRDLGNAERFDRELRSVMRRPWRERLFREPPLSQQLVKPCDRQRLGRFDNDRRLFARGMALRRSARLAAEGRNVRPAPSRVRDRSCTQPHV